MHKIIIIGISFLLCSCDNSSTSQVLDKRIMIEDFVSPTPKALMLAINSKRKESRICIESEGLVGPSDALEWNKHLYYSAYEHSRDMALSNIFSHTGSGNESDITGALENKKSLFSERIHRHLDIGSASTGENIAVGMIAIDEVLEAWLKSPEHCANIMNNNFTDVGIGIVVDEESEYGIYWTQDFVRTY